MRRLAPKIKFDYKRERERPQFCIVDLDYNIHTIVAMRKILK